MTPRPDAPPAPPPAAGADDATQEDALDLMALTFRKLSDGDEQQAA
jgi:hypothetical protein